MPPAEAGDLEGPSGQLEGGAGTGIGQKIPGGRRWDLSPVTGAFISFQSRRHWHRQQQNTYTTVPGMRNAAP